MCLVQVADHQQPLRAEWAIIGMRRQAGYSKLDA